MSYRLLSKSLKSFLISTLFICYAFSSSALELRETYRSFHRFCRRALIHLKITQDPRKLRLHRLTVEGEIQKKTLLYKSRGEVNPRFEAELEYLTDLGYSRALLLRIRKKEPKLFLKILYHPNNRPQTFYRLTRISREKFTLDYRTFYFSIFMMSNDYDYYGKSRQWLIGELSGGGELIQQRLQVPNFGWRYGKSEAMMDVPGGANYPIVKAEYTQDLALLITDLRFVEDPVEKDRWYPIDEIIVDGRISLSPK